LSRDAVALSMLASRAQSTLMQPYGPDASYGLVFLPRRSLAISVEDRRVSISSVVIAATVR